MNENKNAAKESNMPFVQNKENRASSLGLDSPVKIKVAIVTGASRGIGHGIAERLLEKGYCVVASARTITVSAGIPASSAVSMIQRASSLESLSH